MKQETLRAVRALLTLTCSLVVSSCERPTPPVVPPPVASPQVAPPSSPEALKAPELERAAPVERPAWRRDGVARVVAVGDVHGDFEALSAALKAAGLVSERGDWIGSEAVLVQTGDLLDRGDDEQQLIDFLDRLGEQARQAGGDVVELLGNHETMNVQGDLRYVTPGGFKDFEDLDEALDLDDERVKRLPQEARARRAAFLPGAPYAARLARHNTIAVVNDTVFAHGGVLPHHVDYGIERLNAEVSAWMMGSSELPKVMAGDQAPTWTRLYATPADQAPSDPCAVLDQALAKLEVSRMVLGHTVQPEGPRSLCEGRLWLIDVGMAKHYGGQPAALEILEDGTTRILSASALSQPATQK